MSSSSNYNTSTPPYNGRLGYNAGSSWCSATSDSFPYLQINLNTPYVICGVSTQGDHMSNQWVQAYYVQTSSDGRSFTDYKQNNIVKEFAGNIDPNTIVQNLLYEGTVGQYVRIRPKSHYGSTSCMRTELYGLPQTTVCSRISTGISSPTIVPDHRFTASSYYSSDFVPSNARLRKNNVAWEPAKGKQPGSWLHIDLGSVVYICTVATQGNGHSANEYVKKYKLKTSSDNINWKYYQEKNADKIFTGNTNKNDIVTNTLTIPTRAKFIRFYPVDWKGYAAMRVEIYGVPLACKKPFGLEKGGKLGDIKITSSSTVDNSHDASDGRLYGNTSWCSSTSSNSEYIQIDFGKMVTLTGIATQGDHTMDKWVKTYIIKYSINGIQWNDHREDGNSAEIFQGNSDRSSIAVRWLSHPLTVRYIKVHPQTWNNAVCMRIEVFGCNYPSAPEITELSNKNLTASSGSYVELTCQVKEPLIQYIEWYSNGTDVTSLSGGITRDVTSVKSVLRVNYTNAIDLTRKYQCFNEVNIMVCRRNYVCKSKYGKQNSEADSVKSAQVQVILDTCPVLPSPLLYVFAKSVIVIWTYPVNSYVKTVMVKYWNHQITKTVNASYPATNLTTTGLSPCTYYNVTIKAVSELGNGPWTTIRNFRTDSELPKVAPSGVSARAKTSQSILVTWKVPAGISCSPNGYKVVFTTAPGRPGQSVFVSGFQNTSYTLTNLKKWTEYFILVQVHNKKGDGPLSTVVKERTLEDAPDAAPDNFQVRPINSTSVRLSWNLPPGNQQNGIIRGFKVYYYKAFAISCPPGESPQINILWNKTFHYVLGNLATNTEYTFKILAYTIKDGPYSKEITQKRNQIAVTDVSSGRTLSYILGAIIAVLIAIIIALLFYIRQLRNHINGKCCFFL
ncbi:Coagulation factor VIII [Exaiptasia diaphana]|nr:Coagulation factor VIII [Exaiptasia diaphana]